MLSVRSGKSRSEKSEKSEKSERAELADAEPSKHHKRKGLRGKLRGARRKVKSSDDKSWLASVAPPPTSEVVAYLESFGYAPADAQTWDDLPQDEVPEGLERSGPWLGLGIAEHQEQGGHTWYQVECSLALPGSRTVEWQVSRRLQHLRELWHDRVKAELGKVYKQNFEEVHFAHHGGRKGTSSRLNTWCTRLAACINAGQLPPAAVALTLRFVEAPDLARQQELLQQAPRGPTVAPLRVPPAGRPAPCSPGALGEESVSSRSTRCSLSEGDQQPRATSSFDGSDASGSDAGEEEYESDFETDSESGSEWSGEEGEP